MGIRPETVFDEVAAALLFVAGIIVGALGMLVYLLWGV